MKAAFYNGNGKMQIKEHPDPTPESGDAIIQVRATGICGSDLLMNNDKEEADELPTGHEVTGQIVEVGSEVDRNLIGQRVAIETIGQGRACSTCWYCRMGQYRQCQNMAVVEGGGFAEFIRRKAIGCYQIGESMTWEEGALVEPLAVSIHGIRRGLMNGAETVAILGSGTIGLTAVVAARQLGAGKIFVTARHKQQANMALALGADYACDPSNGDFERLILENTEGRGADLTVETVGGKSNATLTQSVKSTRMQGRIVILGGFRTPLEFDWLQPLLKEQSFIFSSCYGVLNGYHDYEMAIELLSQKENKLSEIVTHKFSLKDIQKGFECAYDKTTGSIKVQIHQE
ncbi:MAG TPA: zinc-binding dehydrogenase [SAR202 cluster bacterium]|jgi:(R,R)-butanediol dehydrogenase/meso-butanediol dehydrogenase/diacetyl reductase/L-iditol 2-dehydrogenase|uniref:Enoyl reductase (ER) domain-containing protein n=1 Tax=marine metagenome TaxID=408172 RepID=A0A382L4H4_9ZZZZ|nr:zinc-binding dehydrogenase [SAR202 cluster bacterium]|tara:strand:+ start:9991 stop:11025 length:1035 start_codon:yes stop_codon:yes gene_type:complete